MEGKVFVFYRGIRPKGSKQPYESKTYKTYR